TTTSLLTLPDFASVFKFNERVSNLEKALTEIKKVDQYAQALFSIPAIVDRYMDNKLGEAINKKIIKEEVNAQLPHILPQAISDVATPVIEKNVTESLEVVVLTRGVETTKTKIKSPPLDQTEGRKEGNQVKMLSLTEIQGMQQDQEFVTRDNDEQPADNEVTKADWIKKLERPPTPDPN
nr:hypothetical protein [Tanacetum cinerariifolium]